MDVMDVVVACADGTEAGVVLDCKLEVAFGADENALAMTCRAEDAPPVGGYAYVDLTEYGGVVDRVSEEPGLPGVRVVTCRGRSWHGILAGKRIVPPPGSSHVVLSGTMEGAVGELIALMGLGGLFAPAPDATEASFTVERFADGYTALRGLAAAHGRVLALRRRFGAVEVSMEEPRAPLADSDQLDFKITRVHRCVNHLVCAGSGEGVERTVIHLYADETGEVSQAQSLFGVDEITALYDYPNADDGQLLEEGVKKLGDMQSEGSVAATVRDGIDARVGDVLTGMDAPSGRSVSAEVQKKVVKVDCGVPSVSYEAGPAGEATTSTSTMTGGGGSSGGHAYYAGEGLTLTGWTFSADVTRADLDDVASAAASKVSEVAGAYPIMSERSGGLATVSVEMAGTGDANSWFA